MATVSIEIAASVYRGVSSSTNVEPANPRPVPPPKAQESAASQAVEVSVSQESKEKPKGGSTERALVKERIAAEKQAERLEQSLNKTALKFDVKLFGEESAGPGAISAFRFQVVEKETGKVVRQFPPDEIMKVTQSPEGIFVNQSA